MDEGKLVKTQQDVVKAQQIPFLTSNRSLVPEIYDDTVSTSKSHDSYRYGKKIGCILEPGQLITSFMAAREDGLFFNFTSLDEFEVVAPKTGLQLSCR